MIKDVNGRFNKYLRLDKFYYIETLNYLKMICYDIFCFFVPLKVIIFLIDKNYCKKLKIQ